MQLSRYGEGLCKWGRQLTRAAYYFFLGLTHKLFRNCLNCGLILCHQASRLGACPFCAHGFNQPAGLASLSSALGKAMTLRESLLKADAAQLNGAVQEVGEDAVAQTKFWRASEIDGRQKEIEEFKERMERQREERLTYDLSQMLSRQ